MCKNRCILCVGAVCRRRHRALGGTIDGICIPLCASQAVFGRPNVHPTLKRLAYDLCKIATLSDSDYDFLVRSIKVSMRMGRSSIGEGGGSTHAACIV